MKSAVKNAVKIQYITSAVLLILVILSVSPGIAHMQMESTVTMKEQVDFSPPLITQSNDYLQVTVSGANGVLTKDGAPALPVCSKVFEFPLGSRLNSVEVRSTDSHFIQLEGHVQPVPLKQNIGSQLLLIPDYRNEEIYSGEQQYPSTWYTVTMGAGLNKNNERVLFVTVRLTPVRYLPAQQVLEYRTGFSISIDVTVAAPHPIPLISYSLMIIAPSEYCEILAPLVDHKIQYGVSTLLVSLDDIYASYPGRDNAEKIKYFIKNAIEQYDSQYVLLVGDIKKLPMRSTHASWWEPDLLTDQYYADIYNAYAEFCCWDENGNNRFGEIDHDGNDIDGVDLYADVHVGRIPCADETELTTVINKIITYEKETYGQSWFERIILAGGDTFPPSYGAPPFVYEGEITNSMVGQMLPDFQHTYLWASKRTLHPTTFNRAISRGAGFVSYAGHGFEHGWGTFRPNAMTKKMIFYFTPFIAGMRNGNRLPVFFFDACLTAKLDFNVVDLQGYFQGITPLLIRLFGLSDDPSQFYPCFAWSVISKQHGGGIGAIGSTRLAYTWVDSNGVHAGAGYLDVHFFKAYEPGVSLGEMLTSAQNDYINYVGADYFTIEEFMLLGDPSLRVGGYS